MMPVIPSFSRVQVRQARMIWRLARAMREVRAEVYREGKGKFTASAVRARAGVSLATFYGLFRSLEDLEGRTTLAGDPTSDTDEAFQDYYRRVFPRGG